MRWSLTIKVRILHLSVQHQKLMLKKLFNIVVGGFLNGGLRVIMQMIGYSNGKTKSQEGYIIYIYMIDYSRFEVHIFVFPSLWWSSDCADGMLRRVLGRFSPRCELMLTGIIPCSKKNTILVPKMCSYGLLDHGFCPCFQYWWSWAACAHCWSRLNVFQVCDSGNNPTWLI